MGAMNATILQLAEARGVTANALKKWRKRKYVPSKYHLDLLEEAARAGVDLRRSDLDWRQRPAPKKRRQ